MNTQRLIQELDVEIERLKRARAILAGGVTKAVVVKPARKKKRNLTPEGRARIAAAVKARWARQKKAAK
jgi:hypothetical protein